MDWSTQRKHMRRRFDGFLSSLSVNTLTGRVHVWRPHIWPSFSDTRQGTTETPPHIRARRSLRNSVIPQWNDGIASSSGHCPAQALTARSWPVAISCHVHARLEPRKAAIGSTRTRIGRSSALHAVITAGAIDERARWTTSLRKRRSLAR